MDILKTTITNNPNVIGNLEIIENFAMPQFSDGRTRTIRIWTPANYVSDGKRLYPVIYMHDGQNLFDPATSFAGEWGVDESISALIEEGFSKGMIVVGIDNSPKRMVEYMPSWDERLEAEGELYGRFIVETLKPYIDGHYLTKIDKNNTAIAGSSMGGLISFYIGLLYPEVFGMIGAFSPAFSQAKNRGRRKFIKDLDLTIEQPRLYLDAGKKEALYRDLKPVANELVNAGYPAELIHIIINKNHAHNEEAWRERFPAAVKWLFTASNGNFE